MTLAEALAEVDLEAGRTYNCEVKGQRITVRVAAGPAAPAARYDESDVMLEPWCELPPQGKLIPNPRIRWGELPLDIPDIPQDEE
jgi:hypothetical protein